MSLDRSLKTHGGLVRSRSVLTRAERIARMTDEGKFDPERDSPLGLTKTKVRHSKAGTKSKKAEEKAAAAAEGEAAAEAPGAEGKAPAKGEARAAAKGEAKGGGKRDKG